MTGPPPSAYAAKVRTPFALLGIRTLQGRIAAIEFLPRGGRAQAPRDAVAERAVREIERYLDDPQFRFTLPLMPAETAFRQSLREALLRIPLGESRTYGELARSLHTAPRAVGGGCGANAIAVMVPCHRVVGSRGSLGGFMNATSDGPLAIKRWLLQHEGYRFGA